MAVAGCPLLWLKDYVKIKLLIELETWKSENQVQREKSRGRGAQQQQYTARGYWGQGKENMCGDVDVDVRCCWCFPNVCICRRGEI